MSHFADGDPGIKIEGVPMPDRPCRKTVNWRCPGHGLLKLPTKTKKENAMKDSLKEIAKLFFLGFLLDFFYIWWLRSINKDDMLLAAVASVLVMLVTLLGTIDIVEEKWRLVPYLLGVATGTMVSMNVF